ncbi:MAG: Smr/MutS family protein [Bacteroidales bacterium]|nr:Smr/MutS family protein [Bacteroidales bacterium]MBP9512692.1 Smr/MutS family protein [Bacteroidales bacterium]MDI9574519.1 Smr/MutS family protein [Bacteroidota bacterium]
MIYPENFEKKIGFTEIRVLIENECISSMGRDEVKSMEFETDCGQIEMLLKQVGEMMLILQYEDYFPSQDFFDLRSELIRIKPEGTYILMEVLPDLRSSVFTLQQILDFFTRTKEGTYPYLRKLSSKVVLEKSIHQKLNLLLTEKGELRDDASEKLMKIRQQIRQKENLAVQRIHEILVEAKKSKLLPSDTEITIRNSRMVLPIPSSGKRQLHGFVHDVSASGQTIFVEPEEVFEINNDIIELKASEKKEIIAILTAFADYLRPHLDDLIEAYTFMGVIDFNRAKARFSISIHSSIPKLQPYSLIQWLGAYHPLLLLKNQAQKKPVVPMDLILNEDQRILIISGPNAGGKSVCLRTAGLLQYMLQCGIPIPVKETSTAGIFWDIFLDIGDEQSIENDLSSYSSHLLNMKFFLKNATSQTLFLIDEMGEGTEPRVGGAIAEAILEKLSQQKAFGVITTHYSNLKSLEGKVEGIVNGAMLFDIHRMQPLYRLQIGKPGSSFAFEIAHILGFPEEVMQLAAEKTGETQLSFDHQILRIEDEKNQLEQKKAELQLADELLTRALKRYQDLYNQLDQSKKEILKKAREEAAELIRQSNRLIEKTIEEIKKSDAERKTTQKLRETLKEFQKVLEEESKELEPRPIHLVKQEINDNKESTNETKPLQVGDWVRIKNLDASGELFSLNGQDAVVIINSVKLNIRADRLEPASKPVFEKKIRGHLLEDINQKLQDFRLTIDVRGNCAEDALAQVNHYIDEAVLLGIKEIRILHGKGNGILRNIIREHLNQHQSVSAFSDETPEKGGSGITLVKIK